MYNRHLDDILKSHFSKYRQVLVLLGPRQVGKTTILKRLFPNAQYLNVDYDQVKNALDRYDISAYKRILQPNIKTIIIDEAQRLKDPGRAIKIIYDQLPQYQIIVTGSSSFHIKNKTSESLAGRKISYQIFPLTLNEFLFQQNLEPDMSLSPFPAIINNTLNNDIIKLYDHHFLLDQIMLYGLYPNLIEQPQNSTFLYNLAESVIFRDLEELSLLENKKAAINLLKLLALQIGSLINYSELSARIGIDSKTVKRYIELFEQSFIIFTLLPYSSFKRDEIGKAPKVYFYDLGLRNALIHNFDPIDTRSDKDALFENFVIAELIKYNSYGNFDYHFNYWRTKNGSEVDLVLSRPNQLIAIEIKSHPRRINRSFLTRFPNAQLHVITRDNYWV